MSEEQKQDTLERKYAKIILEMTKQAQYIERRTKCNACIVICMFEDGAHLRVQDAGRFPMPPADFYQLMQQAHVNGQLGENSPKLKPSGIIKH